MKERPILFSAPMVRAILEGRKTQTRRVVKPQPPAGESFVRFSDGWAFGRMRDSENAFTHVRCPYGAPGELLWVRETFAVQCCVDGEPPPFNDGRPIWRRPAEDVEGELPAWRQAHYRATDPEPSLWYEDEHCSKCQDENDGHVHWKPSIHMPRWASRITLKVTDVRVERLQEISENDSKAEGVSAPAWIDPANDDEPTWRSGYRKLWEQINGADSWAANPWVWVVSFERVIK